MLTEVLPADSGRPPLYFHKGGQGYRPASVPYGHIPADALESPPIAHFTKPHLDAYGGDPGRVVRPS